MLESLKYQSYTRNHSAWWRKWHNAERYLYTEHASYTFYLLFVQFSDANIRSIYGEMELIWYKVKLNSLEFCRILLAYSINGLIKMIMLRCANLFQKRKQQPNNGNSLHNSHNIIMWHVQPSNSMHEYHLYTI